MTPRWCVLLAVISWAEFHQGPSFTNAQAYTLASRNAHDLFNAIYGINEERLGPTSPFDRKDPPRPFGKYDSKPTDQHAPKRDFERGATAGEKSGPVGPKTMKEPLGSFNPNYHQSRSGGGYNTGSYSHSLPHMTPYLGASQGKPPFPRVTHPNSAANDDIQLHIHYTDGPSPPLFPTSYQPRLPQPKTYSPPLPRPVNRESDLPVHGAMRGVPVKYNEQVPPNTLNTNIPYPFLPPMPSSVPIPTSRPAVSEVPQNSPYITFVDMPRQEPAPYNGIENTGTEMSGFNNPGPGFRPLSKDEKSGTHNFGTLPPPLPSPNYDRSPQDTSAYIVEDYSDDSPKGSPGYDEYSKSSKWQDRYQELLPQEYEEMHRKLPNDAAIDPSAVTSGNFQLSNRDIINRMNTFKSPFNFDGNLQSQSRHDNGNINEAGRQLPSVYQNIPIPGNGFQFPNQNVLNPMATFQNANGNSKNVNRNVFNPNGHLQNHNGNVQDVNRNIQNQNGKKQSPSGPSPYLTLNTQGIGQSSFPQYPLINLVPQYVNYPKNTNEESLNKFNQGINFPIAGAGKPFVPSTNSMIKPTPVTDLQELAKQRDALSKSFMGSMNRQSPLHPIAGAGKPFVPITKGIIKPTPVTDLQELAKQRDALSKSFMRAMKAKFGNDKPSKPQEVVHVAPGLPKHKPVDMGAKAPALTSGLRNSQQSKTRFLNVNKMFQNPSGNVQNFRTQNQNSPFATKSSAVETKGSENSNRKSRGRGQNNLRNRNMIAQRMRENFRRKFRQSGSKSTSFEDAENADADEVIIQSSGDDDEENSAFKLLPNEASEQVDSEKVMANKKTVKESNAKSGPDLKETTTDSIPAECKDMAMKDPEGKMTPAMRAVMCRLYKGWSDDMKAGASWTPSHKQAQWFESLGSERGDSPQRTKRQAVNKALRQEYRTLTDEQRQLFHDVMNQLKEDSLDGLSKYDIFVNFHRASMAPGAHFGPAFLPWHREFLLRFENALREVNDSVSLPYWDSNLDHMLGDFDAQSSIIWSEDFLGNGKGDVITGAFKFWKLPFPSNQSASGIIYRNLTEPPPEATLEPRLMSDEAILSIVLSDSLRNISWFVDNTFESHHGAVHNWIGGVMSDLPVSPSDPAFFMHHAYIDCLWEQMRGGQRFVGIDPRYDYPNDTEALGIGVVQPDGSSLQSVEESPHYSLSIMQPFRPLRNIDGLSNEYFDEFYECASVPVCFVNNFDCGSRYLFCDRSSLNCLPKLQFGALCVSFAISQPCMNGVCCRGRCRRTCPVPNDSIMTGDRIDALDSSQSAVVLQNESNSAMSESFVMLDNTDPVTDSNESLAIVQNENKALNKSILDAENIMESRVNGSDVIAENEREMLMMETVFT